MNGGSLKCYYAKQVHTDTVTDIFIHDATQTQILLFLRNYFRLYAKLL